MSEELNLFSTLRDKFMEQLRTYQPGSAPNNLYEPIRYILASEGKRIRPTLAMLAAEASGAEERDAVAVALCVELFHNFSLIHDDIMDEAPLRRGRPTVHQKYDLNTGVLSGDMTLILAYRCLENLSSNQLGKIFQLFNYTAEQVCQGQQYDMDFEERADVTADEYLKMIELKTAVLLGASLQMGYLVGNGKEEDGEALYSFGRHLGLSFQLMDDYLDSFGEVENTGKKVGGDIENHKKTYLWIQLQQLLSSEEQQSFSVNKERLKGQEWIDYVLQLYRDKQVDEMNLALAKEQYKKGIDKLTACGIPEKYKASLRSLSASLLKRIT